MSGEFILGSLGAAFAIAFMWMGVNMAGMDGLRMTVRVGGCVMLVALGLAVAVGTMALLDWLGAL